MNAIQISYVAHKSAYDAAIQAEDWNEVERLEDELLAAEEVLATWAIATMIERGYAKEDVELVRDNWRFKPDEFLPRMVRL